MLLKQSALSIQQTAKSVCEKYGSSAEAFAMEQMQDFMDKDDAKGAAYWMAVLHEIKRLPSSRVN